MRQWPWFITADQAATVFFAAQQRPWLTTVMRVVTQFCSSTVCIPASILCFASSQEPLSRIGATVLISEGILLPLIICLRYLTRRQRPLAVIARPWAPWNRYSFPSHHAARAWMFTAIVFQYYPWIFPAITVVPAFISASRIYMKKHYLTDVIAGGLLGLCVTVLAMFILHYKTS